jgi:hypothetical protein
MELVQARIVSDDVEGMAGSYAALLGASVTLNEYYVEVPAAAARIGFSKPVSPSARCRLVPRSSSTSRCRTWTPSSPESTPSESSG